MPDFEDVFDSLRMDLADNEVEKARVNGFIQGKTYARKEILWLIIWFSLLSFTSYIFMF